MPIASTLSEEEQKTFNQSFKNSVSGSIWLLELINQFKANSKIPNISRNIEFAGDDESEKSIYEVKVEGGTLSAKLYMLQGVTINKKLNLLGIQALTQSAYRSIEEIPRKENKAYEPKEEAKKKYFEETLGAEIIKKITKLKSQDLYKYQDAVSITPGFVGEWLDDLKDAFKSLINQEKKTFFSKMQPENRKVFFLAMSSEDRKLVFKDLLQQEVKKVVGLYVKFLNANRFGGVDSIMEDIIAATNRFTDMFGNQENEKLVEAFKQFSLPQKMDTITAIDKGMNFAENLAAKIKNASGQAQTERTKKRVGCVFAAIFSAGLSLRKFNFKTIDADYVDNVKSQMREKLKN